MPLPTSMLSALPADLDLEVVSGTMPDSIGGEVYLSAPDPRTPGDYRLFGEGIVFRLSLRPGAHGAVPGRYAWRHNRIDTPSVRLRDKRPEAFLPGPTGLMSPFGAPNLANTAPLPWGERMFVTWDVGRPLEIDPVTLEFVAEVGHRDQWGSFLPGLLPFVFSTAHPVIDPERGCLWTVRQMPIELAPRMVMQPWIVRWSGEGADLDMWPVANARVPGMMHTISQSREWIVLAESGMFRPDPGEIGGQDRTVTNDAAATVYMVRKEQLEMTPPGEAVPAEEFVVAPEFGHFYARYDDSDGVEVLFEHQELMDLGLKLRPEDVDLLGRPVGLAGFYGQAMAPAAASVVHFDPSTGKREDVATLRDPSSYWNLQLSAQDWSREGQAAPTLHHIVMHGYRPETITQRALSLYEDRLERSMLGADETPARLVTVERDGLAVVGEHEYGLDDLPTSPAFVPRDPDSAGTSRHAGSAPGGHDGWVVVPVLSDAGFRVDVFDAASTGAGPVCTLAAPGGGQVPVLLHSAWTPAAVTAPGADRLRFADEATDAALATLPENLAAAVREVRRDLAAVQG